MPPTNATIDAQRCDEPGEDAEREQRAADGEKHERGDVATRAVRHRLVRGLD